MPNLIYTTRENGILYGERAEYRESWTQGSNQVSRTVFCRWTDRKQFVRDFVGTARRGPGKLFLRTLPEFHPEYDWLPCVDMTLLNPEGFVTDVDGVLDFRFADGSEGLAVYRATHANVPYRLLADNELTLGEWQRWTYIRETYQTQAQQVAGGVFKVLDSDPEEIIQEASVLPFYIKEVRLQWFAVPFWDRDRIESRLNKVNSVAFPGFDYNGVIFSYAPETLLFTGMEQEEKRSAAGELLWDLTFIFKWRFSTWNRFFRRNGPGNQGPGFYFVVSKDTNTPPYAAANMFELFHTL